MRLGIFATGALFFVACAGEQESTLSEAGDVKESNELEFTEIRIVDRAPPNVITVTPTVGTTRAVPIYTQPSRYSAKEPKACELIEGTTLNVSELVQTISPDTNGLRNYAVTVLMPGTATYYVGSPPVEDGGIFNPAQADAEEKSRLLEASSISKGKLVGYWEGKEMTAAHPELPPKLPLLYWSKEFTLVELDGGIYAVRLYLGPNKPVPDDVFAKVDCTQTGDKSPRIGYVLLEDETFAGDKSLHLRFPGQ